MKAVIYAGIGLISVAAIFGLTDYYNSQKKGTIGKWDATVEIPAAPETEEGTVTVTPVKNTVPAPVENKSVSTELKAPKKFKNTGKKIRLEDFSRARIPERADIEIITEEPVSKKAAILPENAAAVSAEKVVGNKEEKRKISLDMYSRAPLKKQTKTGKKNSHKD